MMNKVFFMLFSTCTLIYSSLAQANSGWTDYARVTELVPTSLHYYEVSIPVKLNPSGCKNKTWFYKIYGTPGADKIFQTLLEAVKSGNPVRVFVTGRCNLDGYSEISSVSITPQ